MKMKISTYGYVHKRK